MIDKVALRNQIESLPVNSEESIYDEDNVAIALATYFESREDCPDNDEDSETGWSRWAIEKTNEVLDRIVLCLLK